LIKIHGEVLQEKKQKIADKLFQMRETVRDKRKSIDIKSNSTLVNASISVDKSQDDLNRRHTVMETPLRKGIFSKFEKLR
jgi:hypothetical protein